MSQTVLLALIAAGGILLLFVGLARTPSSSAADMVQERLQAYGGGTSGNANGNFKGIQIVEQKRVRFAGVRTLYVHDFDHASRHVF